MKSANAPPFEICSLALHARGASTRHRIDVQRLKGKTNKPLLHHQLSQSIAKLTADDVWDRLIGGLGRKSR